MNENMDRGAAMALADATPIGHIVGVQGPVVEIACERLPPLRQALLATCQSARSWCRRWIGKRCATPA